MLIASLEVSKMSKRHTLSKFNKKDIAEAAGVSRITIDRYCKKNSLCLKSISLLELIDLVIYIRDNNPKYENKGKARDLV
jgi:transcriptional regulator with XRE-family HTH domain